MLSKTLAWGIVGVVAIAIAWWLVDPAGFSQNPVLAWLNGLTLRSQGYHR